MHTLTLSASTAQLTQTRLKCAQNHSTRHSPPSTPTRLHSPVKERERERDRGGFLPAHSPDERKIEGSHFGSSHFGSRLLSLNARFSSFRAFRDRCSRGGKSSRSSSRTLFCCREPWGHCLQRRLRDRQADSPRISSRRFSGGTSSSGDYKYVTVETVAGTPRIISSHFVMGDRPMRNSRSRSSRSRNRSHRGALTFEQDDQEDPVRSSSATSWAQALDVPPGERPVHFLRWTQTSFEEVRIAQKEQKEELKVKRPAWDPRRGPDDPHRETTWKGDGKGKPWARIAKDLPEKGSRKGEQAVSKAGPMRLNR